ncbi:hypothetical protein N7517_003034 [Penicillium concentricum]|uniref:FAD-binding domain-containing protein n=1 Tax=Penicillium concentricum TaxID=293559 RepID=A0A9W9SY72_9EURO|nr:uncharacterized protein N7517_003034 [Penicillium concentricum]KAJ5385123.1 hypothetical protein N7517_003034 [Penicillium concentricum]
MESPKFKVIIVGGSISGLTLAHCLAKANIDHVILEKRAEIAPQEGAFIGIWPNGARILQQLGVYASLEKLTAPLTRMHISFPDGYSFSSLLPKKVHERFGYPIISLDRQKVLEILFEKYPATSNVMTDKRVSEIRLGDQSVSVLTDDGDVFEGDLIVGADGVHSRTRSEMWRLADATDPGYISQRDKEGLKVEYKCVFGISKSIPGLETGEHINRYGDKFSVITFHGKDGRVFWFIIQKLDQAHFYPNVPRYSPEDAANLCGKLADVPILGDICVGDLWENRLVVSMTALEEGLLDTWHFHRIVLLGDSVHKMTPNIGQGANTAIEDAAVLASLIHRLVHVDGISSISDFHVESILREYRSLRYDPAKSTYERSRFGARFHTRDDWAKAVVGRYVFPFIGGLVEYGTEKVLARGEMIDFLPFPERSGPGWIQKSPKAQKAARLQWRLLWIFPLTLCWAFLWIRPYQA